MEKVKISNYQLYTLMVLFGLGSSSVLGLGKEAMQDAWISIIIGCCFGVIIFLLYGMIIKNYPDYSIIEILNKTFGSKLGKIIGFIYIIYFAFYTSVVLRDIFELLSLYVMTETPIFVLALVSIIVFAYATFLGIETIVRFGVLIFVISIPLKLLFILGTIASGITALENLLPVLENGLRPVIGASFPLITGIPFGQMFIFLMVLPYVKEKEKTVKTSIYAIITTGIILLLITIENIITLGPLFIDLSVFPTIQTIRLVNIMNFFQRLEGLAVVVFLTCGFMKGIVYLYSVTIGINMLFNTKNYKFYLIIVLPVILLCSLLYTENLSTHLDLRSSIYLQLINVALEILLPLIIIFIIYIKQLKKNKLN